MKKFWMGAAVCSMLLGTSCQNEEIVSQATAEEYSLTLDMGANSRTMMGNNGAVWGTNESLYVVGEGGKSYGTLKMVWRSEDGKSAMFSGKITGDASKLEHMVYPVPTTDNKIQMNAMDGSSHNAPMVGKIEDGEVTGLGYQGGLVKLDFSSAAVGESFTVKATDNAGISIVGGYYTFDPVNGTLTYTETTGDVLEISDVPANGIVWVPVDSDAPKDTQETITVSVTDEHGNTISDNVKVAEGAAAATPDNSFPEMIYDEQTGLAPSDDAITEVAGEVTLNTAFVNGGQYTLTSNVTITQALTLAEGKALYLDLGEFTITAGFAGGAIINNGTLNITNGSIVNANAGTADAAGRAHGIVNYGTLTLKDVNVGSDEMGGNAVRNEGGDITINGGTFKSRDRSTNQGWGYVFYNIAGTMTINNANSTGKPNGMFSCDSGEIDVNGGSYTIEGGANTYYMALATVDGEPDGEIPGGTIYLNEGNFNWNKGTDCRDIAVIGNVIIDHTKANCNWVTKVTTVEELQNTINAATPGNACNIVMKSGEYPVVIKVTGGKNLSFSPMKEGDVVVLAGVDHQSNGTPSNVAMNDLIIDNSLQTEGWFTGTGNNIKPCVGIWGGNFTFNECHFIVSGESKAETGVMTWWTTAPTMSLIFNYCTFDGLNNHKSARAMQIYGNVNMDVTGCTFNTFKDYSLKYVGENGNIATFKHNVVNNSENFVELGSSAYPGENCIVNFIGSILANGINNYVIANEEGQTVNVENKKVYPQN